MARIRAQAERKAVPPGIVAGILAAIGGRLFSGPAKTAGGKIAQGIAEMGAQTLGSMFGEYLGQKNETGKVTSPKAIVATGAGQATTHVANIAAGKFSETVHGNLRSIELGNMAKQLVHSENSFFSKFSSQLREYIEGKLATNIILSIGSPSPLLKLVGFFPSEITLTQKILTKAQKHGVNPADLLTLPEQVNDPVMIFRSEGRPDNRTLLTELKTEDGRPVVVSIKIGVDRQGKGVVNDIRSIHGKEHVQRLMDWALKKNLLLYWNMKKSRTFLQDSAPANWEQYVEALGHLHTRTENDPIQMKNK